MIPTQRVLSVLVVDDHPVVREGLRSMLSSDPGIEKDTAHIKIIVLTGLTHESDRQSTAEAGADGYFTKPFSPAH